VLRNTTKPQVLPWPAGSPAADPQKNAAYGFDLDKARYLLRQAGVTTLDIEMIWSSAYGDLKGFAEIYQSDLAKIGVKAAIRPLEANQWREQQQRQTYKGINLTFAGPTHLDPVTLTELRNFSPKANASGFKSAAYSDLVQAVARETQPDRRRALFDRLNDFYLDECFTIPISGHPTSVLFRSNIKGLDYTMHEAVDFSRAWIEG
jgi:peptide/nickel transport system substrate-binding protein